MTAGLILPLLLIVFLISSSDNDRIQRQKEFNDQYGIYALDLPENPTFAGEAIPVHEADVAERFDRELLVNTYWQSQTLLLLKRKERWFGLIENVLKENRIPDDFKYLALAESGLLNVVSPSGAAGYWQFLEATGIRYGLEISSEVDERYNVEKATRAACSYFKESYAEFGSWSLVAASYNMGIDGVRKQLEKQKSKNYYDLLLNEETSRYLLRISALKEICSDPLKYGFHLRNRDFYQPYKSYPVTVDSAITDLTDFAYLNGINYKELKLLNPWLRTGTLTNKNRKSYQVLILKKNQLDQPNAPIDTSRILIKPTKEMHQE